MLSRTLPKMTSSTGKIKLLCLHGYTQNGSTFSSRLGSFRKGLKSRCEFVFIDAPFQSTGLPSAQDTEEAQGLETGGLSWWNWRDTGPTARPSKAAEYTGWDTTLSTLVAAINEHQPHGILGFSQGATAAALFLANMHQPEIAKQLTATPSFAILVAGFLPRDPTYASMAQAAPITVPTLFIQGESDNLVTMDRSKALMDCFHQDCLRTYIHPGAHMVPTCSGTFKQLLVDFLEDTMKGGSSQSERAVAAEALRTEVVTA